jgi:hypothetical protein
MYAAGLTELGGTYSQRAIDHFEERAKGGTGRLVSVSKRIVYGDASSIDSKDITISLVERLNLTLRRENSTFQRKTLPFAKDEGELKAHLVLQAAYYHFVSPHLSL